jgi:hypothetical protein
LDRDLLEVLQLLLTEQELMKTHILHHLLAFFAAWQIPLLRKKQMPGLGKPEEVKQ